MMCPILQVGILANPDRELSDLRLGQGHGECVGEEYAWWSKHEQTCDPTGTLHFQHEALAKEVDL